MKGYPKSKFDIVNQSQIREIEVVTPVDPAPLVMAVYTSDKGNEDWELLTSYEEFIKSHGGINFNRHGQAQLTVAEALRNGAYVLGKRVVSADANVANAVIRARVLKIGSGDAATSYVYLYADSIENPGKDKDSILEDMNVEYGTTTPFDFDATVPVEVSAEVDEETGTVIREGYTYIDIPLFGVVAAGSGESDIYFRLYPEYLASKSNNYLKYSFETEANSLLDNVVCAVNPDVVFDGVNQSIENKVNTVSSNVQVKVFEDGIYRLAVELAKTATINGTAVAAEDLLNMDMLNAMDRTGKVVIGNVITEAQSDDASDLWTNNMPAEIASLVNATSLHKDSIGVQLKNGSYGTLGFDPSKNTIELTNLYRGAWGAGTEADPQFDPVIYDLDKYKVDVVFDANFPASVKNAIIKVLDFRGDASFLADLGMNGLTTVDAIVQAKNSTFPTSTDPDDDMNSKFCAIYHNYFDIISPYDNKRIKVTMPFLLISRLIEHYRNGVGRPFAGIMNQLTFPEIIRKSINFEPVIIPNDDQKQTLVDNNINYISSYDGVYVMETMYTNDDEYSQLSFLHNILLVQTVIKDLRTTCPRMRYTFIDGEDLSKYIEDCEVVLNKYKSWFSSINMTYMQDEKYEANNIFYAVIEVRFKKFIQEEYFKVIALS